MTFVPTAVGVTVGVEWLEWNGCVIHEQCAKQGLYTELSFEACQCTLCHLSIEVLLPVLTACRPSPCVLCPSTGNWQLAERL